MIEICFSQNSNFSDPWSIGCTKVEDDEEGQGEEEKDDGTLSKKQWTESGRKFKSCQEEPSKEKLDN